MTSAGRLGLRRWRVRTDCAWRRWRRWGRRRRVRRWPRWGTASPERRARPRPRRFPRHHPRVLSPGLRRRRGTAQVDEGLRRCPRRRPGVPGPVLGRGMRVQVHAPGRHDGRVHRHGLAVRVRRFVVGPDVQAVASRQEAAAAVRALSRVRRVRVLRQGPAGLRGDDERRARGALHADDEAFARAIADDVAGARASGGPGRRGGAGGGRQRFEAVEDRRLGRGRRREQARGGREGRGRARRRGWTRGGEVLQVSGNGTLGGRVSAGVRAE